VNKALIEPPFLVAVEPKKFSVPVPAAPVPLRHCPVMATVAEYQVKVSGANSGTRTSLLAMRPRMSCLFGR
jgi:hypothetical protein